MENSDRPGHPSEALLLAVDAVTLAVPDLDDAIAFYRDRLGHRLLWRNNEIGQPALGCPQSHTEIVLTTQSPTEPNWLIRGLSKGRYESDESGHKLGR